MRPVRRLIRSQTLADSLATLVVAVVVAGPAIFTHNGFAFDYTNHLWLVWVQEQAISQHLAPTYFVNAPATGIFYPVFMFYGATLYALAGGVAAFLGGRIAVAYIGTSVASIIAAYGGMVWLARQFGVRSWLAHAPALTFVASAYYVTNIYGRGAWTEFVATSMLPLVAASGLSLLRSRTAGIVPSVLFVGSMIVFAGSHNITLLLGSVTFALLAAGLLVAVGREALPSPRRALLVGMLAVASVAVDAWFLLPDVIHANSTAIGAGPLVPWTNTTEFNTFGALFYPLRLIPRQSIIPGLFVQAPDWFLLWSLAAGVAFWPVAGRRLRRVGGVLITLFVLVLLCIMAEPVWNALPRVVREAQFPFRFNTYVALFIGGLVLTVALALQRSAQMRRRRGFEVALVAAATISCALCVWQLWVPNDRVGLSYANWKGVFVSTHATPLTWNGSADYKDVGAPLVGVKGGMLVDPNLIHSDHVKLTLTPPAGFAPFAMNLGGGPYAVSVGGGLVRVGRDTNNDTVVRRRSKASGPVAFSLSPADGSVSVGKAISEAAIVCLLLALLSAAGRKLCMRIRPTSLRSHVNRARATTASAVDQATRPG
jgi:hypothetical protein